MWLRFKRHFKELSRKEYSIIIGEKFFQGWIPAEGRSAKPLGDYAIFEEGFPELLRIAREVEKVPINLGDKYPHILEDSLKKKYGLSISAMRRHAKKIISVDNAMKAVTVTPRSERTLTNFITKDFKRLQSLYGLQSMRQISLKDIP